MPTDSPRSFFFRPETQRSGGQSFPVPFMGGNKVTLIFDKLPISKKELDKLKGWIDLFEDALTEEKEISEKYPD